MNPMPSDARFDERLRAVHARAVASLPVAVQSQLALRRREALAGGSTPAPSRRAPWVAALAAVCAVAVGLPFAFRPQGGLPAPADPPVQAVVAVVAPADAGTVLAEDPDFYLWLASAEATAYAVE